MNETILNQIEQHAKRIDLNERALVDIFNRVSKLETCVKIADANESCTAPVPISEATLREHKEALFNANKEIEGLREELGKATHHAGHLEARIRVLKEERDDQGKEIVELKKELFGWHELFGTKHLSSAKVSKESAESIRSNMADANEWQGNKIATLNDQITNQGIIIKEYREKVEALIRERDYEKNRADGNWDACEKIRKERDAFKFESDNQAAAWKEIKTFIPDVNGLSLVGMVRRHVQELQAENAALEDRNNAQLENIELIQKELAELKANNRYQKGYGDGAGAVIKQVRDLAAKLKA